MVTAAAVTSGGIVISGTTCWTYPGFKKQHTRDGYGNTNVGDELFLY